MGRRSKYPEEFRRNAAKLALDGGRSVRDVAPELGVNHETLRNWVEQLRKERRDGPAAVSGEERAELARLRLPGPHVADTIHSESRLSPASRQSEVEAGTSRGSSPTCRYSPTPVASYANNARRLLLFSAGGVRCLDSADDHDKSSPVLYDDTSRAEVRSGTSRAAADFSCLPG
jgi:transposase